MAVPTQPLRAQPKPRGQLRWRDVGTFTISMVVVLGFLAYAFAVTFWTSVPTADPGVIVKLASLGNLRDEFDKDL